MTMPLMIRKMGMISIPAAVPRNDSETKILRPSSGRLKISGYRERSAKNSR